MVRKGTQILTITGKKGAPEKEEIDNYKNEAKTFKRIEGRDEQVDEPGRQGGGEEGAEAERALQEEVGALGQAVEQRRALRGPFEDAVDRKSVV